MRQNLRILALSQYDGRCAFTGIRQPIPNLRYASGNSIPRFEAHVCHIKPLFCDGPDDISNILLATATFHYLFDMGLIGLEDDFSIICSPHWSRS